jgi:hypothetical protein
MAQSASVMPRYTTRVLLLLLAAGCRPPTEAPPIPVVDFIRNFDRADKRPAAAFQIADRGRPSILAPAPGRLTWALPLPRRGRFQAYAAVDGSVPVRFRVGVSDARIYETLADVVVQPAERWTPVHADLSAYAGRKWSLFYRPDTINWHIVLSTDAVGGVPSRGVWVAPEVVTDRAGAIEYERRRLRQADAMRR